MISQLDKQNALQSALYYLCDSQPFYGAMLQELTLQYSNKVPTAGITFDKNRGQFEIHFNPEYFCKLTTDERVAVFHHEILHFTNKHLFRMPFLAASQEDRMLYNMAGDMAINQYIANLPKEGINVKDWKETIPGKTAKDPVTEKPFPLKQAMETYYDLIKNNKPSNKELLDKYQPFDEHDWYEIDEETKQKMLAEAKKIITRSIEKTSNAHSLVPEGIKDLLQEIDSLTAALDYKQILRKVIKRTVSCTDRVGTWKRSNKRYGLVAPGTKVGALPKCAFFNDSSGSISVTEQNEYLRMMDGFLKAGSRSCTLGFWHTNLYYKKPYRKGGIISPDMMESGGTDVACVLNDIKKNNYNLSIIFTDGFFDSVDISMSNEIIWIISKDGNKSHPMSHIGKTIMLDGIKDK